MKMKDKNAEQIVRKQEHKARLQASKRHQEEPVFELGPPTRLERPRILIVCEGMNTEPSYFRQFRLTSAEIVPLGAGCDTIRVVERAQNEYQKSNYDQVWVVFDKDDFPAQNFDNAVFMAEGLGFGVAYSNQAFEYWLILHFEDHQGAAMHRDDYDAKINGYLRPFGLQYDGKGSKIITSDIFNLLMGKDGKTGVQRIQRAIKRAERNYNWLTSHSSPATEESSTTVFRLVEEILKYV